LFCLYLVICNKETVHVYEIKEIVLEAENQYNNPYQDVECWVQLKGPNFNRKVYGFWDGANIFKVRIVATRPGVWKWESGSNTEDIGLNARRGTFRAIPWSEQELKENPNRRGFIQPTANNHALQYADGTPFFFIGDTWWSASTWRYPLKGEEPDPNWEPGEEDFSFENVLHYRKRQGYNSLAMIAAFPNWDNDGFHSDYKDENGVYIRGAWKIIDTVAMDMHDEYGNRPFFMTDKQPLADLDRINPAYFRSLDKKMDYIASQGFVPFFEAIRRDIGPSWKAYFEWPQSYVRYIQYIVARYGVYNMIFSPLHLDWLKGACLPPAEFNKALVAWYERYGKLPYRQPVTALINNATHITFGVEDEVPWLTMHSVGNEPRDNRMYPIIEEQFNLKNHTPTANFEAYYPAWEHNSLSYATDEWPQYNSDRDNYFGRTMAWGSVLSGALSGHIYGSGAYDGKTVGEVRNKHPFIWEALQFPAGKQVGYLRKFIESEGAEYQNLKLASDKLSPRVSEGSVEGGLDGWAFMMQTPDKKLNMLYFENKCEVPQITGLLSNTEYNLIWFDPITGEWLKNVETTKTTAEGILKITSFPDDTRISQRDWSLKIKKKV